MDWEFVERLFQFHTSLDVETYNLDITTREIADVVNVMSKTDPSTCNRHAHQIINAAKKEYASEVRSDYTLIGSTLKTYAKVYEVLKGEWEQLIDDRFSELGLTYNSKKNSTGLNIVPVRTALHSIREIEKTLKTQNKTPGNMSSAVPSGRGMS